jgi:hypothetical protein
VDDAKGECAMSLLDLHLTWMRAHSCEQDPANRDEVGHEWLRVVWHSERCDGYVLSKGVQSHCTLLWIFRTAS